MPIDPNNIPPAILEQAIQRVQAEQAQQTQQQPVQAQQTVQQDGTVSQTQTRTAIEDRTPPPQPAGSPADQMAMQAMGVLPPQMQQQQPQQNIPPMQAPEAASAFGVPEQGPQGGSPGLLNPQALLAANPELALSPQVQQQGQEMQLAKGEKFNAPGSMAMPSGQEKANGGQVATAPNIKKATEAEEEGEEDPDDTSDLEKNKSKYKKSVTENDLLKAANALENMASGSSEILEDDERTRLAKAFADGSISDEDKDLFKSYLEDDEDEDDYMQKSFAEMATEDPDITSGAADNDDYAVGDFLKRNAAFVGAAIDHINNDLGKSISEATDLLKAHSNILVKLSKAFVGQSIELSEQKKINNEQGELIKSIKADFDSYLNAPEPRRSVPNALQKAHFHGTGFGGQQQQSPFGDLTKSEIDQGLRMLSQKYPQSPTAAGNDVSVETATFESGHGLSKSMISEVRQVLGKPPIQQ